MAGRLSHAVWYAPRLLRLGEYSPDKSRSLAPAIAMGLALACASFALVVSILWLLAPEGAGFAARSVVVTLPFPPDEHPAGPPASAGIDGGLIVPPMTAAAFNRLPPLAPDAPLAPAPDPALIQTTAFGGLPVIAADGRLPRQIYARPHDAADARAKLVIIVAGIGLNRAASEAAIERLPAAVVLAIDAYADRPDAWARAARHAGHELLAMVPLQEADSTLYERGPWALRASASADENGKRLQTVLGAFTGYVGMLGVGARAPEPNDGDFEVLLGAARSRGLLLVDGTEDKAAPLARMTRSPDAPVVRADMVIDPAGALAIDRQLADLEKIAGARSSGVAMAQAYPATLERLRAWMSALDDRRYVLAPVSALITAEGVP